ncbi:hypothetical protein [Streptomyces sp. NPDC015125]|uniref:hypothetical protein n=1 Tax=Streptomyces sp. NPDC015125 TaxID=3364938 RepID=UPI0036FA45EE
MIATQTQQTSADADEAVVWLLQFAEYMEGGHIVGAFDEFALGLSEFITQAQGLHERVEEVRQEPDGSVRLRAGCDSLSLKPYRVTGPTTGVWVVEEGEEYMGGTLTGVFCDPFHAFEAFRAAADPSVTLGCLLLRPDNSMRISSSGCDWVQLRLLTVRSRTEYG